MKIKLPTLKKPAAPRNAPRRSQVKRAPRLKLNAAIARRAPRALPEEDEDYFDEEAEPNMKLSHAFVVVLVLHVIAVAGVFAFNSIKTKQSPVFAEAEAESSSSAAAVNAAAVSPDASTAPSIASAPRQFEPTSRAPITQQSQSAPVSASAADPAPATRSSGKTHEIRPGDTLTRLSSLYGVSVAAIQQANQIEDPTKIRVGATLMIPTESAAAQSAPATAPATTQVAAAKPAAAAPAQTAANTATSETAQGSAELYEVVAGDNPWTIAKKLKVSYQRLIEVNEIEDPTKIQIGQKLKVPAN